MKIRTSTIAGLFAVAAIGLAPSASAGIVGTPHDLSLRPWNVQHDLCTVCHIPHHAISDVAPLWNHRVTTSTFVVYASPTLNAHPTQPQGVSRACLSCHDGTLGIDAYGSSAGGAEFVAGGANLGTDLSTTHPISFTFDDALATADKGLFPPTTHLIDTGFGYDNVTVQNAMLYSIVGTTIRNQLECPSCHTVHDNTNLKFLRIRFAYGTLCLQCHNK